MEKVILKAEARTLTGKKVAKDLRRQELIPAIVYKGGKEGIKLQLSRRSMNEALQTKAGENVLITLEVSGDKAAKPKTVLVKEIQREPIKNQILHVDFNEISLTDMLKVNVPLHVKGEAIGVTKDGGVLDHVMWELHVECLPTDIPEKIEVDITNLNIGEAVHVKDIKAPEGVKITNDPELIAIIIKHPKVEAPKVEGEEAVSAEPELIRKKKEEEGAEGEAPAKDAKEPAKEGK